MSEPSLSIELRKLADLEEALRVRRPEEAGEPSGFLSPSASGFLSPSASGFLSPSASGFLSP